MLNTFLRNHVLANLVTVLVIVIGFYSYFKLPREQDPEVNLNWVQIFTVLPGAAAEDVEREVTSPLEDGIRKVSDIKFVSSTSRESISSILVRFDDIGDNLFDKRVTDLRRELTNKYTTDLPRTAKEPSLTIVKSSNVFPTAMLVLTGQADDELLRKTAENFKTDIERLEGVESVLPIGISKPEIHVEFDNDRLEALHISPIELADTVAAHFRDTTAGSASLGDQQWLVRMQGRSIDPEYIAKLPIIKAGGVTPLEAVSRVSRAHEKRAHIVRINGKPAALLQISKKSKANTLDLVDQLKTFIDEKSPNLKTQGMQLILADDQAPRIKGSIEMMEQNAIYGLLLMLAITWLFLGWRLSLLNAFVIPFVLAGLFWIMNIAGLTLNTAVLIGILIALGMVVDGSVVVIDSINYRLQRGSRLIKAVLRGLREVTVPVLISVLTAIAAFIPLIFMPGILGKFMLMVPLVVTICLLISLVDAFWLLPAHIVMLKVRFKETNRANYLRLKSSKWLTKKYYNALLLILRRPVISAIVSVLLIVLAVILVVTEQVKMEYFADDPIRLFHINVDMAPGTGLEETLRVTERIESVARKYIKPEEVRAIIVHPGFYMTSKEPLIADNLGQITVSLNPQTDDGRDVNAIITAMKTALEATPGPSKVSFLTRSSGPPVSKPIEIKARGDNYETLRAAVDTLETYLNSVPAVKNLRDDDNLGKMELKLSMNTEAAQKAGLSPADINRILRLSFDGDIVGQIQSEGEKVEIRVLGRKEIMGDIDAIIKQPVTLPGGGKISLGELVNIEKRQGKANIRHYNFRRTITIESDLDKTQLDTVKVNKMVKAKWSEIENQFPGVTLDFTGELDDIYESIGTLGLLMIMAVGVIYIILGAQFKSYLQPLIIFLALPLAFTGVVFGLFLTGNPLSLYTMYGMIALTGVIISTAIVLIAAGNYRKERGGDPLKSTLYAATRRFVPIVLTAVTTFVDLIPLAAGWGGKSLIWSPMATAIVYGLLVSTILTLFMIPLLYFILELAKYRDMPKSAKSLVSR